MPGIVGLVTRMPRDMAERELRRMVETLRHEAFYETGTWVDESLGIYIGWSALKESFSSGMPLSNEQGDVVLVFSGEEFPTSAAMSSHESRGQRVRAVGPTYLVDVCEDAESFPAGLNGRFHGLLVDRAHGTATLFNDRYGMHRIHYHESKDAFYFAVEAKAILAVRPELKAIDIRGFGEFVSLGCILENRTWFNGIHVLPGASCWVFQGGVLERKGRYFHPSEWEEQEPLAPEEYYQRLREVFTRNLPLYFEGPQRIGVSLTGGLDTRMIMAWQKCPVGSLPCYTFGGARRESQDVVVGREVARVCNQPYSVITAGNDLLSRFSHYAERSVYLTDGCVDLSLSPDLYMYEKAREIAPIRMSGNYGGEVLRRVRAFKPVEPLTGLFQEASLAAVHAARETYAETIRQHPLSFAVFFQAPWHHYGVLALEQTQLTLRTPYLDNELVQTVFRAPESACSSDDVCLRLIGDGSEPLRRIRTDRGVGGGAWRVAAATRRSYLEFLFKAEYAYDYGMPQSLARIDHLFSSLHLERLFLGRHKFYHFRVWYRDVLSAYVREMLLDKRALSRGYVERKKVEAVVAGHLNGDHNYTLELHKLLTLELVHRLFVDA